MTYFKILSETGEVVGYEAIEDPVYVRWQERPPMLIRCSERQAEGLISDADNDTIYQLAGKHLNGVESELLSAVVISEAEYDEYMATQGGGEPEPDPEDDNPEIPADDPDAEVLTRAQLTERLHALEDELAAAKILLGVSEA